MRFDTGRNGNGALYEISPGAINDGAYKGFTAVSVVRKERLELRLIH